MRLDIYTQDCGINNNDCNFDILTYKCNLVKYGYNLIRCPFISSILATHYKMTDNHYNRKFILSPIEDYAIVEDTRLLIPFIQNYQIGFMNKDYRIVVDPTFDRIDGEILEPCDVMRVARVFSHGYPGSGKTVRAYTSYNWGVMDSNGQLIIDTEYMDITISDTRSLFTLHSRGHGYCVVNRTGKTIIPYGKYHYITGFWRGFCRVAKQEYTPGCLPIQKWGIVDEYGNEVIPVEYDDIWNFYGKNNLKEVTMVKDHKKLSFVFPEYK